MGCIVGNILFLSSVSLYQLQSLLIVVCADFNQHALPHLTPIGHGMMIKFHVSATLFSYHSNRNVNQWLPVKKKKEKNSIAHFEKQQLEIKIVQKCG